MAMILLKRPHKSQQLILNQAKRFNVLKCGRRFGKTIISENLSILPAAHKKLVGYWTPTYKDVSKVWDEVKFILHPVTIRKDEQLKQIKLHGGGQIDFWSMEDPNNGRGFSYHRIIIDECEKARHLKEAWEKVIRPTLTDYKGDAWFLSTPQFGQTYFKELSQNKFKKGFEDWNSWVMTSYDNPFLSAAEIDSARSQLDDLTFRCEYLAEDVDIVGKPFAYAFSEEKHVGKTEFNGDKEILLGFDFNVDPIVCVAAQLYDDRIEYIEEFTLANSNTYDLCDMIHARFPFAVFAITGDATGRNRSALAQGNINHYDVIKQKLNLVDTQIKAPTINPHIADRRVLLNSVLQNFIVLFDPDNCKKTIRDMKYVEVDDFGEVKKDRTTEKKKADHIDAASYLLSTFMGNFIKIHHAEYEYS
jgi:hypothetical protein